MQVAWLANAAASAPEPLQFLDRPYSWADSKAVPLAALSVFTFLVHGYHPYSEDAAIYVAGIERGIDPSLFRVDHAFVDAHSRLSLFSHVISCVTRYSHLPLDLVLLLVYIVSIIAFLSACHRLATHLFSSKYECWSATFLAAACFTLPAAGTSLLVMDPYLTARSISTPLSLFAVLACLDRSWKRSVTWLAIAFAMHPLMGVYLAGFLLILSLVDHGRFRSAIMVPVLGVLLCAFLALMNTYAPVTAAYREAALSRSYYFLCRWQWYEVMGLVAPLILMGVVTAKCGLCSVAGKLSATCVLIGTAACMVSICLVHPDHPDLLMRVQVLRSFHTVYALGIVMLGGFTASCFRNRRVWIGAALLIAAAAVMFVADRQSYASSPHIEWPGIWSTNPWEQAFLWIHANTPQNAIFATDSHAFERRDEDTQGFRALAGRSILSDSKDEGVVSLFPPLANEWGPRRDAELGLDQLSDNERFCRLRPYGVTWLVLSAQAVTSFACPFRNSAVAVCQMSS